MKSTTFAITVLTALILMFAACSSSPEKKISGEWRVKEVNVEADTSQIDQMRINALKSMEKSVFFILNEDKSLKAITGNTTLDGAWSYDEETGEVLVSFIGAGGGEMNQFGVYDDGEIVKTHESGGVKVITIYEKK